MHFSKIVTILGASALALSAAIPANGISKRALKFRTYDQFQISDGVAGNALAEVNSDFPVDLTNAASVSASDLAILVAARETAENAETTFDTAIAAASGTTATALQNGKIKNKVLKLRLLQMVGQIQEAQGNTNGVASELTQVSTLLATNVKLDDAQAGKASQSISFTDDVQPTN
ncbi:hypothetical protein BX600DRAFT_514982 [Xylariales sp. PMI_506]|nr:hypothetical protein BX600DRAFT_514982 [Xylariales sp. PMI_506]